MSTRLSFLLLSSLFVHLISSIATCRDAKTGAEIYSERIESTGSSSEQSGGGFGGGRRGGGGDYSSPVAANGHLYQVTRRGEVIVIKLGPKFELVARNRIDGDTSDHSATPAISNGKLFLRSSRTLCCIGE